MPLQNPYLFTSERLGFRNWKSDDLDELAALCADPAVMKYFPATLTREESEAYLQRLQKHYDTYGYNYYAVERLDKGEWIGLIGLAYQTYEVDFLPATDIGWRLKQSAWGKGYATEGAKRCLSHGFETLGLERIVSTCVIQNSPSENVMQKIGMTRMSEFDHPKLWDYPENLRCVWYEMTPEADQIQRYS